MLIDKFGVVSIDNESEALKILYSGLKLDSVLFSPSIADQYNKSIDTNQDNIQKLNIYKETNQSLDDYDKINQSKWFMPDDYFPNLFEYLYSLCDTEVKKERVTLELELYNKNNMIDLLFYLKYLVDVMRKNNIVWGVGRGSCVSSYILYLIGVHKIDSIYFNLDIHEFLK